jgi:hypothetical protein
MNTQYLCEQIIGTLLALHSVFIEVAFFVII